MGGSRRNTWRHLLGCPSSTLSTHTLRVGRAEDLRQCQIIQCNKMGWSTENSIIPGQSSKGWGQLKAYPCSCDGVPLRWNCWLLCCQVQSTWLLGFTGCPSNCGVWARAPHQAQPDGKAMAQEASDHMDSPYELHLVCRASLWPLC